MTHSYFAAVNIDVSGKKMLQQFRLPPSIIEELQSLSKASGMDKTEIVEIAIAHVRVVVERITAERLASIQELKFLENHISMTKRFQSSNSPRIEELEKWTEEIRQKIGDLKTTNSTSPGHVPALEAVETDTSRLKTSSSSLGKKLAEANFGRKLTKYERRAALKKPKAKRKTGRIHRS